MTSSFLNEMHDVIGVNFMPLKKLIKPIKKRLILCLYLNYYTFMSSLYIFFVAERVLVCAHKT